MAVELAVLMPVVIVVALVVVNVLQFTELCARFDRVAMDSVVVFGVSPVGTDEAGAMQAVQEHIASAMDAPGCEVKVRVEEGMASQGEATFTLAAGTVRYVCELGFRPWPTSIGVAGVSASLPVVARHERTLVVDRYRAAVVT